MVFTVEEEEILKLMVKETKARIKLNQKMREKDADYSQQANPLRQQVDSSYAVEMVVLRDAFNKAERNLRELIE